MNIHEYQAKEVFRRFGIRTLEGSMASSGDDAWDVDVSGDLLSGSSTIGSLEASFTGSRCEVPANEETLNGQ